MISMLNNCLGGLGLFLVGMWLMTDGLKLAAGNALRNILQSWTNTRYRGLVTGFSITALVQSSSAVTVATIGFANAGLLTLERAIWVIFGSNLGTTMTGWIVAFVGLKINMEAYALPLIGIGMIIRLSGQKSKRAAIGQTLVGFGLFFLGIGILKEAFDSIGGQFSLPSMEQANISAMLVYLLIGFVLTSIMQSSSAAIVITLSAADAGLITLSAAAATVIGANLGTTTTAILSVIGATATAKRVAISHVIFNLVAASVAIIIIIPMLTLIVFIQDVFHLSTAIAASLALFHTVFNFLGVLLMMPISSWMVNFLNNRFISADEKVGKPLYLDKNSMEVPELAISALMQELEHLNDLVAGTCSVAIEKQNASSEELHRAKESIEQLATFIADSVAQLSQAGISEEVANALPEVIAISQRASMNIDNAIDIVEEAGNIAISETNLEILTAIENYKKTTVQILKASTGQPLPSQQDDMYSSLNEVEQAYKQLKRDILFAGINRKVAMHSVDAQLTQLTLIRRIARQVVKTSRQYLELRQLVEKPGIDYVPEVAPSQAPVDTPDTL